MARRTKETEEPRMGRPPIFGERMKRISILVTNDDLERADKIGDGNVSAGIRIALEQIARNVEHVRRNVEHSTRLLERVTRKIQKRKKK